MLLEICLTSVEDAIAAQEAGADRLELSCALMFDGLTPSPGLLRSVKKAVALPIVTMIRPRAGGFRYSAADFDVMRIDTEWALAYGSDSIAFGILDENQGIDVPRCRTLLETVGARTAVFHRAFDLTRDPFTALECLIDLGFTRVMTSGACRTALEGSSRIRELIERSRGRIEILPAGGINHSNVREILMTTGATQVHGSFRRNNTRSGDGEGLDAMEVLKTRAALDSIS